MSRNDIDEHYRVAWAGYPDDSWSRVPVPIPWKASLLKCT